MGLTTIIWLLYIAISFVDGEDKKVEDKNKFGKFSKDLVGLFHFEPQDKITQKANSTHNPSGHKFSKELNNTFHGLTVGQLENFISSESLDNKSQMNKSRKANSTLALDNETAMEYIGPVMEKQFKEQQYKPQNSTKIKRHVKPLKVRFKFLKWFLRKFKKKQHMVEEWAPKRQKLPWSKLITVDDHLRKRARKRAFKARIRQYWDYALRRLRIRKEPKLEYPKDLEFLKDLRAGKYDKFFAKRKIFNNMSPEQQRAHLESIKHDIRTATPDPYLSKKWKKWKSPYNPSWGASTLKHSDIVPDHLTDAPYWGVPTKSSPNDPIYNYGPRYDRWDRPITEKQWDSRQHHNTQNTKQAHKNYHQKHFAYSTQDPEEWKWPEKPPDREKGEKLKDTWGAHADPRQPGQRKKIRTTTDPTKTPTKYPPRQRGYTSTAPWYKKEPELVVKYPNGTTGIINVHGKLRKPTTEPSRTDNKNGHNVKNSNGAGNNHRPTFKMYRVKTTIDPFDPAHHYDPRKYPIQYDYGRKRTTYIPPSKLPRSRKGGYMEENRDYARVMKFIEESRKEEQEAAERRRMKQTGKHGKKGGPLRPIAEYRTIPPSKHYHKNTKAYAKKFGSTSSTTTEDPTEWEKELEKEKKLKEYDKLSWEEKEWRRYQQELRERKDIRKNTFKRRLKKLWDFIWPFGKKKSDQDHTGNTHHKTLHDLKPKPPHYLDDSSKPMPENWREQFSRNYPREEAERARKEALSRDRARGLTTPSPRRKYGKPGYRHHSFGQAFRDSTATPPPSLIRPEVKAHNDKVDAEIAAKEAKEAQKKKDREEYFKAAKEAEEEHQRNVEATLKKWEAKSKKQTTTTTPRPKSWKKT